MTTTAINKTVGDKTDSAGTPDKAMRAAGAVGAWLLACAGMVFAMAIIGAITRLTESGLSITEWRPITGTLPPLNEAQWLAEFEKYRQIPEYQVINRGMSLDEFKFIYFWEWFHRLWGRLIGVVFVVPFAWFWATGRLTRDLKWKGLGLLALGGLQGFLGWFMVQSGLVDRTDVSHYRLALHLGVAFLIFALLVKVALDVLDPRPADAKPAWTATRTATRIAALRAHLWGATVLLTITIVWGAFVAGMDAGHAYNTWPLMGDSLAPPEMWNLSPAAVNFVENTAAVQFAHRWLAILTGLAIWTWCWRAGGHGPGRNGTGGRLRATALALGVMTAVQVLLGISTLLSVVWIPLAAAHQGGAFVLVALIVLCFHELGRPEPAGAVMRPA